MSTTAASPPDGILRTLRTTKAWILLAILLAYVTGLMLMIPVLPDLMTDDFASRRAGERIYCEHFSPDESPTACRDAHSDVVLWSTWSGFAQNTLFSVILTPALGAWSDIHGRKPFLILAQGLACLPYAVVLLNLQIGTPLSWVYVVQALTGAVSMIAPSLAYIADVVPPVHRAACFGAIMASFSVAVLIGPPLGALLQPATAPAVTIGVVVLCMLCTLILLPESLSPQAKQQARQRQLSNPKPTGPLAALSSTWHALAILRRSQLFVRLTLVLMAGAVVSEGLNDVLIQYLQLKLGFGAKDVAYLFMTFGAGALLVQVVLLRVMLSLLGECRLLVLGIGAGAVQQLFLALAVRKWQALGAVFLGSFGSVTFPTISSIKANNALEHEQGSVQGALYGARAMASGFGPLVFAAIFAGFTRSDSPLPFYPGAPFILGAVLMVGTMALAGSLPADAGGNGGSLTLFRNMSGGVSMQRTGGRGKHGRDDPEAAAAEEEGLLGEGGGSGGESRPPSGEGTDHYDGRTDNQR